MVSNWEYISSQSSRQFRLAFAAGFAAKEYEFEQENQYNAQCVESADGLRGLCAIP